jgi:hypothetical protein
LRCEVSRLEQEQATAKENAESAEGAEVSERLLRKANSRFPAGMTARKANAKACAGVFALRIAWLEPFVEGNDSSSFIREVWPNGVS